MVPRVPVFDLCAFKQCVNSSGSLLCSCREMQQHVAALQAELKAAQAAADLEATLKEFKNFIDNGQHWAGLLCCCSWVNSHNAPTSHQEMQQMEHCVDGRWQRQPAIRF